MFSTAWLLGLWAWWDAGWAGHVLCCHVSPTRRLSQRAVQRMCAAVGLCPDRRTGWAEAQTCLCRPYVQGKGDTGEKMREKKGLPEACCV